MKNFKNTLLQLCAIGLCASLIAACGGGNSTAPATAHVQPKAPVQASTVVAAPDEDDAPHGDLAGAPDGEEATGSDDASGVLASLRPHDFVIEGYGKSSIGAGAQRTLYVSPHGADSNDGSADAPLRSLARAARLVRPGTTVLVAPGNYTGGFRTTVGGTPDARIAFVSAKRWGARILPPALSRNKVGWDNRASYVDIVGFEVDGSAHQDGVPWTHGIYNGGSHDVIRNNWVHHIAVNTPCTRAGGAGIGADSYYRGVQSDIIGNRVHDIGPAGCRFIQGIYMSTSGSIKNNVVFRVAEGGIHLWHDARNVIITNNTVTDSNTGIIVGGGNFYHSSGPNDHTAVYSNIVYGNRMGISEQGRTGLNNSYRNNLVYQNSVYNWRLKNGLTHSGTVSAAPGFAGEARRSATDLKLAADSPAIGNATPSHADSTDIDGRERSDATGYDIGAYQH